jgi:hypothetical protein
MGGTQVVRFLALILAYALPCVASGAGVTAPTRITVFDTHSGIQVTALTIGDASGKYMSDQVANTHVACLSFKNTNTSDAKLVTFHLVYYDSLSNHAGEGEIVRAGTFATGVVIAGDNPKTGKVNMEDCTIIPYHQQDFGLILIFVKAVTYANETLWSTPGPAIPEHLQIPPPGPAP